MKTKITLVMLLLFMLLTACTAAGPVTAEASTGERALPRENDTLLAEGKAYSDKTDIDSVADDIGVPAESLGIANPGIENAIPIYTPIDVPEIWRFRWKATIPWSEDQSAFVFAQGIEIHIVDRDSDALVVKFLGKMCGMIGNGSGDKLYCVATDESEWKYIAVESIENGCYQWTVNSVTVPEPCPQE